MSYTCPTCQMTIHNPNDEKYRYCGNCNKYEDDLDFNNFMLRKYDNGCYALITKSSYVVIASGTLSEITEKIRDLVLELAGVLYEIKTVASQET